MTYDDDIFPALVAEINIDEDDDALNKKSTNLTDDHKCVYFKVLSGLVAEANKFPLLHHFGIPVENI